MVRTYNLYRIHYRRYKGWESNLKEDRHPEKEMFLDKSMWEKIVETLYFVRDTKPFKNPPPPLLYIILLAMYPDIQSDPNSTQQSDRYTTWRWQDWIVEYRNIIVLTTKYILCSTTVTRCS
jgi:hypothetical protein